MLNQKSINRDVSTEFHISKYSLWKKRSELYICPCFFRKKKRKENLNETEKKSVLKLFLFLLKTVFSCVPLFPSSTEVSSHRPSASTTRISPGGKKNKKERWRTENVKKDRNEFFSDMIYISVYESATTFFFLLFSLFLLLQLLKEIYNLKLKIQTEKQKTKKSKKRHKQQMKEVFISFSLTFSFSLLTTFSLSSVAPVPDISFFFHLFQ